MNELTLLTVTNRSDRFRCARQHVELRSCSVAPAGAAIGSVGRDHLDPDRGAGPGDLHADDRGDRQRGAGLSATNSFTVTVNDVNLRPGPGGSEQPDGERTGAT